MTEESRVGLTHGCVWQTPLQEAIHLSANAWILCILILQSVREWYHRPMCHRLAVERYLETLSLKYLLILCPSTSRPYIELIVPDFQALARLSTCATIFSAFAFGIVFLQFHFLK